LRIVESISRAGADAEKERIKVQARVEAGPRPRRAVRSVVACSIVYECILSCLELSMSRMKTMQQLGALL
jgi:hypothetical protein